MEQSVQDFIAGNRIELVGISRSGKKFGNIASKELKERGYQVYPIHPEAEQIGYRDSKQIAMMSGIRVKIIRMWLPNTG